MSKYLKIFILLIASIAMGFIIPMLMDDGISSLPKEQQKYGRIALDSARYALDHPVQKLHGRNLKIISLEIDPNSNKVKAKVSVNTFYCIPYCKINLNGDTRKNGYSSSILNKTPFL